MNKDIDQVDSDFFLDGLKTKFIYLLHKIKKEKLVLLFPPKHLITKNMIYLHFYANHIIYPSPYDPQKFINLNGKVLQRSEDIFTSYIGWSQQVQVTIKEKVIWALEMGNLEYQSIDNICDDIHYKKPEQDIIKFPMTTFIISEGYISYYYQERFVTIEEYCIAENKLEHFLELMNNHFVLTKNNEAAYFEEFKLRLSPVIEAFKIAIDTSFAINEHIFDQVVCELIQSLIFSKKNLYNNIMDKLILFTEEEEQYYLDKIIENKNDFKIPCKESQLKEAKEIIQELPQAKTFYEKNLIYQRINAILKERKDLNPDADAFLSLWVYLINQKAITNIFAEILFYYYFHEVFYGQDMTEKGYLSTTFKSVLDNLKLAVNAKNNPPVYTFNQKLMIIPFKVDISAIQRLAQDTSSNTSKLKKTKTIVKQIETPQG